MSWEFQISFILDKMSYAAQHVYKKAEFFAGKSGKK